MKYVHTVGSLVFLKLPYQVYERTPDFFRRCFFKDLEKHVTSGVGKTPEDFALLFCKLDVYEGIPFRQLEEMRVKTLTTQQKASLTTVACFAAELTEDERKITMTTALRGFLKTEHPDFKDLLKDSGFDRFVDNLVRNRLSSQKLDNKIPQVLVVSRDLLFRAPMLLASRTVPKHEKCVCVILRIMHSTHTGSAGARLYCVDRFDRFASMANAEPELPRTLGQRKEVMLPSQSLSV